MSVTYLGRNRVLNADPDVPLAQLVNVPELQGCQRCQFCHYYAAGRDYDAYEACSHANRCGDESLLYVRLNNIYAQRPTLSRDFTPTQLFRQRVINDLPRYLQYFTADISGFQCNHLCQFYPNRIASEQTIASCSNTNACGRNGSFFNLLLLQDKRLLTLPDFQSLSYTLGEIPLFNGNVLSGVTIEDLDIDSDQTARLMLSDGTSRVVVLLINDSPIAGNILRFLQTTSNCYCFERAGIAAQSVPTDSVVILSSDDYAAQWIDLHTSLDDPFYTQLTNLRLLSWGSSRRGWFTTLPDFLDLYPVDDAYLVIFQSVDLHYKMAVRFLTEDGAWLAADRNDPTPSHWRRIKTTGAVPDDVSWVTLTSYNGSWATWLRQSGVRDSVLKVLP